MATIASLSLNLSVGLAGWTSGLAKATGSFNKFAGDVGGKLGKFLAPTAEQAKLAALGLAGVGVAAAAAGTALAASGLDRIDALSDASQRLGITTAALSELRYAANLTGSSAEDLDGALEKLSANLGDSASKAGPTAEALKRLGLDAEKLANGETDETFYKIVEGFESIPNAAEKASLAMDIFGKGGLKILNTLGAGSGELDKLAAEARKFGVSVSQVDAAKIGVAKDALDRAGAAVEGIGNTLAIELAPLVEVAANAFTDWLGPTIEQAGGVKGAIEGVASVIGFVGDSAFVVGKSVASAFSSIVEAAASVLEALGISGSLAAHKFAADIKAAADSFDVLPSAKLGKFLDDIKVKAAAAAAESAKVATGNLGAGTKTDSLGKSIEEVTKKLKEQADTFGKTAAEADIYKLAQQGATDAQLADARAQAARLAGLEKGKKADDELKESAKGYFDSTRTAAEKLDKELMDIAKAKDAGLINADTAARARAKAGREAGLDEPAKFAGAAELGSTSAYSSIAAALSGRGNPMDQVAKTSKTTADNTGALVDIFKKVSSFLGQPTPQFVI